VRAVPRRNRVTAKHLELKLILSLPADPAGFLSLESLVAAETDREESILFHCNRILLMHRQIGRMGEQDEAEHFTGYSEEWCG
jgi:hypothetical protein